MTFPSNVSALILAVRLATVELKCGELIRSLERRYSPGQPRVPAGRRDGGQWTSTGGRQRSEQTRVALAAKLIWSATGGGDDKMIRHCLYQDAVGRQYTVEYDATLLCPKTLTVPPYYGPY